MDMIECAARGGRRRGWSSTAPSDSTSGGRAAVVIRMHDATVTIAFVSLPLPAAADPKSALINFPGFRREPLSVAAE